MADSPTAERNRRLVVGISVIVLLAAFVASDATAWRARYVEDGRLLPGTTIAGEAVGGQTVEHAREVAQAAGEEALTRGLSVGLHDRTVEITPQDLGATADPARTAAQAFDATGQAPFHQVVRARWLGTTSDFDIDVAIPADEVAAFVDRVADDFDHVPVEASLEWVDGGLRISPHEDGASVDRRAATSGLRRAALGGAAHVTLPVRTVPASMTTEQAEELKPRLGARIDEALDHVVTVTHEDAEWQLTARDLAAQPRPEAFVESATATVATAGSAGGVPATGAAAPAGDRFSISEARLDAFLDRVADDIEVHPQNARLDYSDGSVHVEGDRAGIELDRDAASAAILAALGGAEDAVPIPVDEIPAEVTTEDYRQVLLVRHDERRLYLYEDGEIAEEWPVAIGAPGSPTPTGEFGIGAMREAPTWYNPAPNGWGAGMPAVVGPGPDNPLGLRALNWERDGHDTLIRFHGTSDTASIGRAASRGCVRLTNDDVVDLFDRVDSGATVVSVSG